MNQTHQDIRVYLTALVLTATLVMAGCDNKKTVLDVEGPKGGGVEIEKDRDTGAISVDVDTNQ